MVQYRFPIRALWLLGEQTLEGNVLYERANRLGFNCLLSEKPSEGLLWIQKAPTLEKIQQTSSDFIFWESQWQQIDFFHHADAENYTRLELITQELDRVERALPNDVELIFYIPGEASASWIPQICDAAGPKTHIAFSAVAGEPMQDHLGPHPLWKILNEIPDSSSTKLLPIVNLGMIGQGWGLWPTIPFDIYERYFCRLRGKDPFAGIIALVPAVPKGHGFLHCALWTGAHLLQKEWQGVDILIEEWFRLFKPDINYFRFADTLKGFRTLTLEASLLRDRDNKSLAEAIKARLLHFEQLLEKEHSSLKDSFTYFAADLRRMISPNSYFEDGDSFWTQKAGSKFVFLEKPQRGKGGSRMAAIYDENLI